MLIVTTSWDDGDRKDERLAALLDRYGIKGTFYISKSYRADHLSEDSIRTLGKRHEIGAHTLTHPDLRTLSSEEAVNEVQGSKIWLENLLQEDVLMFCYPRGYFNDIVQGVACKAGFLGARTTEQGHIHLSTNAYRMPTTVQVYPMPFRKTAHGYYWKRLLQPFQERRPLFIPLDISTFSFRSWEALACATFNKALHDGEIFHLWGHSWEIDQYNMWQELEHVLSYISGRKDCVYSTNGEVIKKYENSYSAR